MKFFKSRKEKILTLIDSEIFHRSMDALELELDLDAYMGCSGVVDHSGLIKIRKEIEEIKALRLKLDRVL